MNERKLYELNNQTFEDFRVKKSEALIHSKIFSSEDVMKYLKTITNGIKRKTFVF